MEPFKAKDKEGPESKVQGIWVTFLEAKGWHVERMAMGAFMSGIPDLNICHPRHGERWFEVKIYGKYSFTRAQKRKFPEWEKSGRGIWILGAASKEACTKEHMLSEYPKLFETPNWRDFWKDSWDNKPDIDQLLGEVDDGTH